MTPGEGRITVPDHIIFLLDYFEVLFRLLARLTCSYGRILTGSLKDIPARVFLSNCQVEIGLSEDFGINTKIGIWFAERC